MSVKFHKNDKTFDTEVCLRGLNLLGHAQWIEFDLGSTCGGHGKCGKDRVRLSPEDLKKVNPPSDIERHQLSKEQLEMGVRLACQCFPSSDGLTIGVQA